MRRILTIVSVIFCPTGTQADVISDRKAGFRGNVAALKKIQAAIGSGDLAAIREGALEIVDWSSRMTEYFEGSDTGDTKARAEIWFDFDDFTARAGNAEKAALALPASPKPVIRISSWMGSRSERHLQGLPFQL